MQHKSFFVFFLQLVSFIGHAIGYSKPFIFKSPLRPFSTHQSFKCTAGCHSRTTTLQLNGNSGSIPPSIVNKTPLTSDILHSSSIWDGPVFSSPFKYPLSLLVGITAISIINPAAVHAAMRSYKSLSPFERTAVVPLYYLSDARGNAFIQQDVTVTLFVLVFFLAISLPLLFYIFQPDSDCFTTNNLFHVI
jgi:hypothetical protein